MKYKTLMFLYLPFLLLMVVVPLGELNTTLSDTFVFELRLDYLVHVLAFLPLVVLWRLGFPGHSWWKVMGVGMALAVGLEGVQYLLPYRSWNVNDAVGNILGVVLGGGVMGSVRGSSGRGSGLRYCIFEKKPQKHNNASLTPASATTPASVTSVPTVPKVKR